MAEETLSEIMPPIERIRAWLSEGEQQMMAGQLHAATQLLRQAWSAADGVEPHLAGCAAWHLAWLQLRLGAYSVAAEWFARVRDAPAYHEAFWLPARQAQVALCRSLAGAPLTPPAPPDAPALPTLAVTNLGSFRLIRGGRELPACRSRKAISLLRYLLSRYPAEAHKEELMELLWPESQPREAGHSLHVAINTLRAHIDPPGGSYITFSVGRYQIAGDAPVIDDARRFHEQCDLADRCRRAGDLPGAQQAYARALAVYQGDYYIANRDQSWELVEQEKLLARYLNALWSYGTLLAALEQHPQAIECFRRLIERDSYREDAHCALMRSYLAIGRRGDAIQQYQRCKALLAEDLGLPPMPETQAAYEAILADRPLQIAIG